jgi:FkbM family methyltransferase
VIDVGANRGQFVLDVLAACCGAEIIAIEPLDSEFAKLVELFAIENRIRCRRMALGSSDGIKPFFISRRPDSSSLLPITQVQTDAFRDTEHASTALVAVRTLDNVLAAEGVLPSRSTFLKLDVQGSELDVLRGATDSLGKIGWAYVELSTEQFYEGQALASDVIAFLRDYGFQLIDIVAEVRREERLVQFDGLFARGADSTPLTAR